MNRAFPIVASLVACSSVMALGLVDWTVDAGCCGQGGLITAAAYDQNTTPAGTEPAGLVQLGASSVAVTMHVADIRVSWTYAGGTRKRPNISVRILDDANNPVYGATVTGNWSGCFNQNGIVTGPTGDLDLNNNGTITADETGWVRMTASRTASCSNTQCRFTFTVTNVNLAGSTYDATQNVETTDFSKCNPFLP